MIMRSSGSSRSRSRSSWKKQKERSPQSEALAINSIGVSIYTISNLGLPPGTPYSPSSALWDLEWISLELAQLWARRFGQFKFKCFGNSFALSKPES